MLSYPIVMDGVTYSGIHVRSIKRNFAVLDGPNATRLSSGGMQRDVIGTFYNYSVEIDADGASRSEYDTFYQTISAPVDSHTITVPYAQTTLTFQAYVANGSDDLQAMEPSANRWGNLSFNFIAMAPQRT